MQIYTTILSGRYLRTFFLNIIIELCPVVLYCKYFILTVCIFDCNAYYLKQNNKKYRKFISRKSFYTNKYLYDYFYNISPFVCLKGFLVEKNKLKMKNVCLFVEINHF